MMDIDPDIYLYINSVYNMHCILHLLIYIVHKMHLYVSV